MAERPGKRFPTSRAIFWSSIESDMTISPELCPWSVPVRLEAGRFVAMLPEHAELNVRTAPLPAFGSDVERCASDQLLYADLQTVLYSHVAGRLGSGREGPGGWDSH